MSEDIQVLDREAIARADTLSLGYSESLRISEVLHRNISRDIIQDHLDIDLSELDVSYPILYTDEVEAAMAEFEFEPAEESEPVHFPEDEFFYDGKIGEGGMGRVDRFIDNDNREVAVKYNLSRTNKEEPYALANEGDILSAVSDNPHFVKLLKQYDDALVLEYLEGETLYEKLSETLNSELITKRLGYVHQVAQAIDYLHSKGYIHRDIKPENVFVLEDDSIKVLDFGLAIPHSYEWNSSSNPLPASFRLNKTIVEGDLQCTIGYASPEQLYGLFVDQSTDVYSLGIILYEAVTDEMPRKNTTKESKKALEEFREQSKSITPPKEKNPDLDDRLNDLIVSMLSITPEDRPELSEVESTLYELINEPALAEPAYV